MTSRAKISKALRRHQDDLFATYRKMAEEGYKLLPTAVVYKKGEMGVIQLHTIPSARWMAAIKGVIAKKEGTAVMAAYVARTVVPTANAAVISMMSSGLDPEEIPTEYMQSSLVVHTEQANGAARTIEGAIGSDGLVAPPTKIGFADLTGRLAGFFPRTSRKRKRRGKRKRKQRAPRLVGEA